MLSPSDLQAVRRFSPMIGDAEATLLVGQLLASGFLERSPAGTLRVSAAGQTAARDLLPAAVGLLIPLC